MIEINLLPQELRKRRKKGISPAETLQFFGMPNINPQSLIKWVIIVFIVVQAILLAAQVSLRVRLAVVKNSYSKVNSQKKNVDSAMAQINEMSKKVTLSEEITKRPFSWTEKLNSLSDSIVPGVWLKELAYDEVLVDVSAKSGGKKQKAPQGKKVEAKQGAKMALTRAITIFGYSYSPNEDQSARVYRFIDGLKANRSFRKDFSTITVDDIKGEKFEGQEIMSFKIICSAKE